MTLMRTAIRQNFKELAMTTPKTPAAKKYYKQHAWALNGNVPGFSKQFYETIARLNKG
jgi:hypothetical protein